MQKAEPQHNQAQNQTAAAQRKGASIESPQGEQLAQLEAMAEASLQADRLAQLAAMANDNPQAAAQRRTMAMIHDGPRMTAQRRAVDAIHSSANVAAQRVDAEEPLQAKVAQRAEAPVKRNDTGLPDSLKSGIESLSGMSMDNVRVHYNSSQPAQLNAHAYAQGTDIHVAPGQEQHLPHEAWHVVQQAQGRVRPTMQMKGDVPVNDDAGLEREADVMGARAISGGVAHERSIMSDTIVSGHMLRREQNAMQMMKDESDITDLGMMGVCEVMEGGESRNKEGTGAAVDTPKEANLKTVGVNDLGAKLDEYPEPSTREGALEGIKKLFGKHGYDVRVNKAAKCPRVVKKYVTKMGTESGDTERYLELPNEWRYDEIIEHEMTHVEQIRKLEQRLRGVQNGGGSNVEGPAIYRLEETVEKMGERMDSGAPLNGTYTSDVKETKGGEKEKAGSKLVMSKLSNARAEVQAYVYEVLKRHARGAPCDEEIVRAEEYRNQLDELMQAKKLSEAKAMKYNKNKGDKTDESDLDRIMQQVCEVSEAREKEYQQIRLQAGINGRSQMSRSSKLY